MRETINVHRVAALCSLLTCGGPLQRDQKNCSTRDGMQEIDIKTGRMIKIGVISKLLEKGSVTRIVILIMYEEKTAP